MTLLPGFAAALGLAVAGLQSASAREAGTLSVQGAGPYYSVPLPMALRSQSATDTLDDLRVLNAQGGPLPFAWAEAPAPALDEQLQRVPFIKLPAAPLSRAASATVDGPAAGWMIDARRIKGALRSLELDLPESARGVYTLALDTSEDLQHWRLLRNAVQIVSLQQQGLRLRNTRVDLDGERPGYLRLRVLPGSAVPELKGAQARSVSQSSVPPPLQWSEPIAPLQCEAQHCDYAVPRHVPLEQVQWQLAEINTLAGVLMLGATESGGQTPGTHHHRLHDRVKALRHKTLTDEAASAAAGASRTLSWRPLAPATLYWLRIGGAEVRSGPIPLDGGQYAQLRLQTEGPTSLLGTRPPRLRVAARTRTLVFLARGTAPYRLEWQAAGSNGRPAGSVAIPLDQLMPTRHAGDALPADTATVQLPAAPAPIASAEAPSATASALSAIGRRGWLWGVLVAGVGLMGLMAHSLLGGRRRR